jgi:hypothetical protein
MNLPTITTPQFEITLPIANKKIKIRPFLAKEEKILLMTIENKNNNENDFKNTIQQIIENCIVTKIDLESLTTIDVEYIFMQLRKISVDEDIKIAYSLRETFNCQLVDCLDQFSFKQPIDSIELKNKENTSKTIMLNDQIGIKFSSLSFKDSMNTNINYNNTEKLFDIIASMIDCIFENDNVIDAKGIKREDLITWIENSFSHKNLEDVLNYIKDQPYFSSNIEIKCAKCKQTKTLEAKGLVDFFSF